MSEKANAYLGHLRRKEIYDRAEEVWNEKERRFVKKASMNEDIIDIGSKRDYKSHIFA
jgi:hypothetical protein